MRTHSGSGRRWLAVISALSLALLLFALYLQYFKGLEPCPMCIVQRYALTGVLLTALIGSMWQRRWWVGLWGFLALLSSGLGAYVAAHQSWLQWNPPEFASCGRNFYGIVESYPISRAIPMLFQGTGECSATHWSLFGLSIANWSFICFAVFFVALLVLFFRSRMRY